MAKLVGDDFELFSKRTKMVNVVILVPEHQALQT
jgi:hypothetical protein